MPPARSRVVEDARSETSFTNHKDRTVSGSAGLKSKKNVVGSTNHTNSALKHNAVIANTATTQVTGSAGELSRETPHVDWPSFPIHALHSYRSAYQLPIQSAHTQPHADLLYKSCELALRAPSQVVARKKTYDLKQYRKKHAQQLRPQANGISKNKSGRAKDTRRSNAKRKENATDHASLQPPIDEPPSPNSNSHPSLQDAGSDPSENASRKSPTVASENEEPAGTEYPYVIPQSLNQTNPEATAIGSLSPTSLATYIRKHFNAQQINEAETIARFTYVTRQQGSSVTSRIQGLAQRAGTTPLPSTTAENIARIAESAKLDLATSTAIAAGSAANTAGAAPTAAATAKSNSSNTHGISVVRTLGGQHIECEGSFGDGEGWVMGTTSCGRQVRIQDSGGTGAFRMRFRP